MNKRIRLLLYLFVFSMPSLMGQVNFGGFLGLNNSKLSGDVPDKAKYKSAKGINAGIFVDFALGENVILSVQPSYSQEGARVLYDVAGVSEPVDSIGIGLDYFSLPVFLKIEATNKRFYALSGIETGFLLSSTTTIDDKKEDLDVKISDVNVAMHFGAGMHIPVGSSRMFVELRYSQGLINLTDEPVTQSIIPRVKTAGLKIIVGYEISFRKTKK